MRCCVAPRFECVRDQSMLIPSIVCSCLWVRRRLSWNAARFPDSFFFWAMKVVSRAIKDAPQDRHSDWAKANTSSFSFRYPTKPQESYTCNVIYKTSRGNRDVTVSSKYQATGSREGMYFSPRGNQEHVNTFQRESENNLETFYHSKIVRNHIEIRLRDLSFRNRLVKICSEHGAKKIQMKSNNKKWISPLSKLEKKKNEINHRVSVSL